ncbi:hypothetical protein N9N28_08185 [Rubripirellula amarantea]|nr:hypothetical protein [Rubripirellula amarantea]
MASSDVTSVDGGSGIDSLRFEGDHDLTLTDLTLTVDSNPPISVTRFESASLTGGDGNNTITAADFSGDVTLSGGIGDDVLVGGAGNDRLITVGGSDSLSGMSGDDVYAFGRDAAGTVTILEASGEGNDHIDLRDLSRGVAIDLKDAFQQSIAMDLDVIIANPGLTSLAEIESVTGTAFADTIYANDLDNTVYGLGGRDLIDGRGGADILYAAGTRLVYLDFDSVTDIGEHVYTQAERDAITTRIADDFAPFDVLVSQTQPASSEEFVTVLINAGIPGGANRAGISEKVGFRELLGNSTVRVDVNVFLRDGGNGLPSTPENFIALTSTIAAHELTHLFGVRHQDAFGDVGNGIYAGLAPDRFRPVYTGPSLASSTINHLISSPASIGTTLVHAAGNPYLGPRESLKLAFGESGDTLTELSDSQKSTAVASGQTVVAQEIGTLQPIRLPVTTGVNETGNVVADVGAAASVVVGSIEIDQATGFSESDYYTFHGVANQIVTIEVMSQTLRHRFSDTIDSVLRLYASDGSAVTEMGSSTSLRNDDTFESPDSILLDVVLPADDTYTVEVETFSFRNPEYAVFPNDLNMDTAAFCIANPDNFNCTDIDTGRYELLIYTIGGESTTEVGGDTLIGGSGPDEFIGSSGDESIPDLDADDTVKDPFGSLVQAIAINPIAGQQTAEGSPISFTVSVVDPLLEGVTYSVSPNDSGSLPNGITLDPVSGVFTYAADDEAAFDLRFMATDQTGNLGIITVPFEVFGVAPELDVVANSDLPLGGNGDTVTVSGVITDASPVDTFSVQVHWGDGFSEPAIVAADGSINLSHTYAAEGPSSVTVEAEDDDELTSSVTIDVVDSRLALISGVLYISGRSSNDYIRIRHIGDDLKVSGVGRSETFAVSDIESIEVRLGEGRNIFIADPTVPAPMTIYGGGTLNIIRAGAGDDTIYGSTGRDIINGRGGDDLIEAGEGNDIVQVSGDESVGDTILAGDGIDRLQLIHQNAIVLSQFSAATSSTEMVIGSSPIFGTEQSDTLNFAYATRFDPTAIDGLGGDDLIILSDAAFVPVDAGSGNDTILGSNGVDQIDGGVGDDQIAGQGGDDILIGGLGIDRFDFNPGDGFDTINDFDAFSLEAIQLGDFGTMRDEVAEILAVSSQRESDVEVELNGLDRLRLIDTALEDLDADDFLF